MTEIALPALRGRNPLGLFAALGVLDVVSHALPDRAITLHWTEGLEPHAVLGGADSIEQIIELCDQDRERWASSPVLTWGPNGGPLDDLKPSLPDLRQWIEVVTATYWETGDDRDIALLTGLVAEGAAAGKGDAKPTHFHFTAGQQKFLVMVRLLQREVTAEHFREALAGPWSYTSTLPVLGWDARGERVWALRGFNPSGDKKRGVPAADWLAFLGLRYFPVALHTDRRGVVQLATTGCELGWKSGSFSWPLWEVTLTSDVVASLLADTRILLMAPDSRRRLGVTEVMTAGIRRSDQGGYGSFGPPSPAGVAGRRPARNGRR
ncbi:hypothetical protein [Micropruina sp.]|uniref:type I-G CRISPR-associated protein, Cas3-extension family n=1 Tax=Micropruina sp. TaxID=2737536 RepID=UPI0039E217C4